MVVMKQTTATAAKPQIPQGDRPVTTPVPSHERTTEGEHDTCSVCGAYPGEDCLTSRELSSEWLAGLNSHSIYDSAALKRSYQLRTGCDAPAWPEYTGPEVNRAIKARGLGGTLVDETKDVMNANGWEVAEAIAKQLAGYSQGYLQGRGSRFRAAVEALRKAGL